VKEEVNGTVILPPLVFPANTISFNLLSSDNLLEGSSEKVNKIEIAKKIN